MIYELRHYEFTSENWPKYLKLFNDVCLPIRQDNFGILKGKWIHSQNGIVHFYHLWEYSSLEHRKQLREKLASIVSWQEDFIRHAVILIENQEIKILNPFMNSQNFDFQNNLNIYQLECNVGSTKSTLLPLIDKHQQNIQINMIEFPNPNELIFFSNQNYNIKKINDSNIKVIKTTEVNVF